MIRIVLSLWMLAALAGACLAQTSDAGIKSTIEQQLDAFEIQDFDTAFSFASPTIKNIFGSPSNFGVMVQRGYPMVIQNSTVKFLELREINGNLWQKVMIQDRLGVFHILDYQMINAGGQWQINGVQLLPSPGVGA